MNTARLLMFVISNLGITLGYVLLGIFIVPKITVRLMRTRIGGVVFFLTCGLHHLEGVFHVLFQANEPVRHVMLQWHMLAIDVPQMFAVGLFVSGLYIELVTWGPWRTQEPPQSDQPDIPAVAPSQ